MAKFTIDQDLLAKLAAKTGKKTQYLREQVSRKAGRLRISSPAALVLWAQEKGISITRALNKLPAEVRDEVRSAQGGPAPTRIGSRETSKPTHSRSQRADASSSGVIDSILKDNTLRERCKKLLQGSKHFDQVFREATTVLDDRLKRKTGIKNMRPVDLVGKAVNPDPQKAIIVVSGDKYEQEGFHSICKGTMLFFRNRAHHALSDSFTREDAFEFCGFIDIVLGVIEQSQIHLDRVQSSP